MLGWLVLATLFSGSHAAVNCTTTLSVPWHTEVLCPTTGEYQFYSVTVAGKSSDAIVSLGLISPANATCHQGICSAPRGYLVTYQVFVGDACLPSFEHNNNMDLTAQFAKQITVCKPCEAKTYYVALRPHLSSMNCSYLLQTPSIETSQDATCSFAQLQDSSQIFRCNSNLVRKYLPASSGAAIVDNPLWGLNIDAIKANPLLVAVFATCGAIFSPLVIFGSKHCFGKSSGLDEENGIQTIPPYTRKSAVVVPTRGQSSSALSSPGVDDGTSLTIIEDLDREAPAELPPTFFSSAAWS